MADDIEEDDGGTGCIFSGTGGKWKGIDHSALHERLIKELPLELQGAARKGRVALRLPSARPPRKQDGG